MIETDHLPTKHEQIAVRQGRDNPDPEVTIEQMIHEVAYERVKHSYLFNTLHNDAVDRKADELAAKIGALVEEWITAELEPYAERQ